jgi:hypothetical protein
LIPLLFYVVMKRIQPESADAVRVEPAGEKE